MAVTDRDTTGRWEEMPQGFRVVTSDDVMASVTCDIGAQGRDFAGPPNYCEMSSSGTFSKSDIRDVAAHVAAAFDTSTFTTLLDDPEPVMLDSTQVMSLIHAAVPTQHLLADTDWGPGDRIFDFAADGELPDTSVRLVEGLWPRPTETSSVVEGALYDDAAAFWIVRPDGLGIRVSTTDPRPASWDRLHQLALDIAAMNNPASIPTTTYVVMPTSTTTPAPSATTPTVYSDTVRPIAHLPAVVQTDLPAINDAYGFGLCSGAPWTKVTQLSTSDGPVHRYEGTLCVMTTIKHATPLTIAGCAAASDGTFYATCQVRANLGIEHDDRTTSAPIAPSPVDALPATDVSAPQSYSASLTAADGGAHFDDGVVSVTLSRGTEKEESCFSIDASAWVADGCLFPDLITTGLAYGAFQDGDGPVEVIGIVPDEVGSVRIAGHDVDVSHNVWRYTAQPGDNVTIELRASDATATCPCT